MTQPNSIIEVIEVCHVKPSQEAPPTSLPLTFFDLYWLRFFPVQRLFFYEFHLSSKHFYHSVLPKLKHSLALTLDHFLPLAGSLTWLHDSPKPILKYVPRDSVPFTIAESEAGFEYLSSTHFCKATEFLPFIPQLAISHEKASALALQVTLFPNSGFCIGITSHHAILDGKTSTSFMKSWAHICKFEESNTPLSLLPEQMPFYDRTVIKDPKAADEIFANSWLKHEGPNNRSLQVWSYQVSPEAVRGIFEMSQQNIEKLRKFILVKTQNDQKLKFLHLSTFALSCAYCWVCLVKALETNYVKTLFLFTVDCRHRLEPNVPQTYFGNCIKTQDCMVDIEDLSGKDGLVVAVRKISEALKSLENGVLDGVENGLNYLFNPLPQGVRIIPISGSPRFEVYGTDFGWGRPKKVDMASIDGTGAICLSDGRKGDGTTEVSLVLKRNEMDAFASYFAQGLEAVEA